MTNFEIEIVDEIPPEKNSRYSGLFNEKIKPLLENAEGKIICFVFKQTKEAYAFRQMLKSHQIVGTSRETKVYVDLRGSLK